MDIVVTDACNVMEIDHKFASYCQEAVLRQACPDLLRSVVSNNMGMREVEHTAVCPDLYKLQVLQRYPDALAPGVYVKYSVVFHFIWMQW